MRQGRRQILCEKMGEKNVFSKNDLMRIKFSLNGELISIDVSPDETLLEVLREKLKVKGVKKGCGEGECGSCTILLDGQPIVSCLLPVAKAANREVLTVEGLTTGADGLHPIQDAFLEAGAVQCGFCTPGMILSAKALLDRCPNPSEDDIKTALSGNICRCTGYVQIQEAVKLASYKMASHKGEK
jgi:aerobic carbon-monoxide dehydrogenase small subunit